jgi:hypothetical protein
LRSDWGSNRLAADTAYGTSKLLHWVIGTGITPHIPVWDMSIYISHTRARDVDNLF